MKNRRIVIASVLKPVDDTRMFEKMGMTLSGSGNYEIFIVGQPSQAAISHPEIQFIPLKKFARISLDRLLAPFKLQRILHQVQPEILIVNTHELLIVAALNRILFGVKIIYDIRENYFLNILYTDAFPILLRPFVACWVRLKEIITARAANAFFLAEKGYQKEMRFFSDRAIVLENKAQIPGDFKRTGSSGGMTLLFSGTLAESTGVFRAISLAKRLHAANTALRFTIIGFCAKENTLQKIRTEIDGLPYVKLIGGDELVPHPEIVHEIAASDFGLISYPPSRLNVNSVPTKLYEYLACRLPILLEKNLVWEEICAPYRACVAVDFQTQDPHQLLAKMSDTFYDTPPIGVTWETEAERLLHAINKI